jgi:hypothetical protein
MPPQPQQENAKAIMGLKSICQNLENLSKQLDERIKIEEQHHKMSTNQITALQIKVETAIKQIHDLDKKLYSIENN